MPNEVAQDLKSTIPPDVTSFKRNYYWSNKWEPHAARRKQILQAHPEIRDLKGPSIKTFFLSAFLIISQLAIARESGNLSLWVLGPVLYIFGATANHTLSLAVHELSHGLCFHARWANRLLAMLCNLPQLVPSGASFRYYHLRHHTSQGVDGVDVDVPSVFEARVFVGPLGKAVWLLLQPLMYALRPLIVSPHPASAEELLNWVLVLASDAFIYTHWGPSALAYLGLSSLVGHGLHPCAGHFIAEHYITTGDPAQETFSYYGPLNWVTFFVGYHNEHHDFPDIAGWNLPKVTKIAPEFYNTLHSYDSWVKVLFQFIFDPNVTLYSRVIRKSK
eukprot:TRINITY_DN2663_c0_g1_i2.p1 TRINITY_DN2663_c0_g1~~TRINITY_DN2663_c0_g1_i2.p1  ORF type:complete len:332 (-),score=43.11 TRINITY_DN2663_c0_g1_i2:237-1232(-)